MSLCFPLTSYPMSTSQHVCVSLCFYLSVFVSWTVILTSVSLVTSVSLCVSTLLFLCLDLLHVCLSFNLYVVMLHCFHISYCVSVPRWPCFRLPNSFFVTGVVTQKWIKKPRFVSLMLSLWLPVPLFVCLMSPYVCYFWFEIPVTCVYICLNCCISLFMFVSLLLCFCVWSSVFGCEYVYICIYCCVMGSFSVHSVIQQIFTKHLLCARQGRYIDDSEKILALKELTV